MTKDHEAIVKCRWRSGGDSVNSGALLRAQGLKALKMLVFLHREGK